MPFVTDPTVKGACITLFGPPKTGKTEALGGLLLALEMWEAELATRFAPTTIWSEEGGHIVIPTPLLTKTHIWVPPPPTIGTNPKGLTTYIYPDAVDNGREVASAFISSPSPVLAIDTISTYSIRVLKTVCAKPLPSGKERQNFTSKGGIIINTPSESDYGAAQTHIKSILYDLHQHIMLTGKLLVLLAHERELGLETEDGITRNASVGPQFVGRDLTREFPKVPHIIARTRIDKGRFTVMTKSESGLYIIGDRLGILPPSLDVTASATADIPHTWATKFWLPILKTLHFTPPAPPDHPAA